VFECVSVCVCMCVCVCVCAAHQRDGCAGCTYFEKKKKKRAHTRIQLISALDLLGFEIYMVSRHCVPSQVCERV